MVKKWEYMIIAYPDKEKLNRLGEDGWELVSVTVGADTNEMTAYLKKEKT